MTVAKTKQRRPRATARQQRSKSQAGALRRWGKRVLALGLLVGIGVGGRWCWQALLDWPRLTIHRFSVAGAMRVSQQEIESYAGTYRGQSILRADLQAMVFALERHPWVKRAAIRRKFPDTLRVDIVEHVPAILVVDGGVYIADKEGRAFKRLGSHDVLDVPVVTGIALRGNGAAQRIVEAHDLAGALQRRRDILGSIDELHWDTDLGWSMLLHGGQHALVAERVRVHLGRQPHRRLGMATHAMREIEKLGRRPAIIWLGAQKNPDRVHVKFHRIAMAAKEK